MRILIVCLGNICRSPLAHAVLRSELDAAGVGDRVVVDSAGTGDWNIGKPPDPRMKAAAGAAGVALDHTARQITAEDLAQSDLILVMDGHNLRDVQALAPDAATRDKVSLFLAYAGQPDTDVPDPYYGGEEGFTAVVELVRDAARTIAQRVAASLQNSGLGAGSPGIGAGPGSGVG
jgi:protein-tyrosine phosphatase